MAKVINSGMDIYELCTAQKRKIDELTRKINKSYDIQNEREKSFIRKIEGIDDFYTKQVSELEAKIEKLKACMKEIAKPNGKRESKGPRMGDALRCLKEVFGE